MEKRESHSIGKESCPKCGSRDNLARYDDGHAYCFTPGCDHYEPGVQDSESFIKREQRRPVNSNLILDGVIEPIEGRRLTQITCEKFGYAKGILGKDKCHIAPYYDAGGHLVAQKIRMPGKKFTILGDMDKAMLFGAQLWGSGRMIVITEGEIDALSVSQIQGNKYPVVSIPTGSKGAKKALTKASEYLSHFEQIILMFDNDEAGKIATTECAEALGPGRCKIAYLPLKDANEMLCAGRTEEVIKAIWQARPYQPEGVVAGADMLETILTEEEYESISYPWPKLNEMTYGMRQGELVTLTAGTGVGKSTVVSELAYWLGNVKKQKVGLIMLEQSAKRTGLGLISIHANRRLHLDRADCSKDQLTQWFTETLGQGYYYLIDHFGSTEMETLKHRVRYLVTAMDCKWVILDHLSIVVSGNDEGDERKTIDLIMTDLRTLVQELEFGLILVNHLRRVSGTDHENGGEVELSHLRGSQSIAQLSDMVIGLERDQQGEKPNVTTVRILKNRFSGETGVGCYLEYDSKEGRLYETDPNFDSGAPEESKEEEIPF